MNTLEKQLHNFSKSIENICCNISIRNDDYGPYILAFGLKDMHSFELRKVADHFALELWVGMNAEEEEVVAEQKFANIQDAFACAKNWLARDDV